jgi:NADH dehydrogenase
VVEIGEGAILVEKPEGRERIAARTAIWASGVIASPLGVKLAMRTAAATDRMGRVIVNPDLTVPGHPEIFVIGDLGHFAHQGGRPLVGVAPVATQQGRYVATLIGNRLAGRKAAKRFSYFDKGTLAVMGRNAAIADIGRWHFGGRFAWFLWLCLHLLLLIHFENRIIVLIRWAFHYLRYNYGARDLALQGTLRLPITDKRPAP